MGGSDLAIGIAPDESALQASTLARSLVVGRCGFAPVCRPATTGYKGLGPSRTGFAALATRFSKLTLPTPERRVRCRALGWALRKLTRSSRCRRAPVPPPLRAVAQAVRKRSIARKHHEAGAEPRYAASDGSPRHPPQDQCERLRSDEGSPDGSLQRRGMGPSRSSDLRKMIDREGPVRCGPSRKYRERGAPILCRKMQRSLRDAGRPRLATLP